MMLHINGLVVSELKIIFMFSYLAYVNHVTSGAVHFWPQGYNLNKCGRGP